MALTLAWLLAPLHDADDAGLGHTGPDNIVSAPSNECSADDAALLMRIRAGDTEAFGALYSERYAELFRSAKRIVHAPAAADEVVQDVFLKLWIRRAEWTVHSSIRAYLHGAVRLRATSFLRHEQMRQTEPIDRATPLETTAPGMSPETVLATADLYQALLTAIRTLPDRQRDALILWSRHHMTLAELGEALGVSHVAARKLLHKAQAKLRAVADAHGGGGVNG